MHQITLILYRWNIYIIDYRTDSVRRCLKTLCIFEEVVIEIYHCHVDASDALTRHPPVKQAFGSPFAEIRSRISYTGSVPNYGMLIIVLLAPVFEEGLENPSTDLAMAQVHDLSSCPRGLTI